MLGVPHPRPDLGQLLVACPGVPFETDPAVVRQKSRDVFWFGPILNRVFRRKSADVVARPRDEADVIAIAAGISVANPHVGTVEDGSRHSARPATSRAARRWSIRTAC